MAQTLKQRYNRRADTLEADADPNAGSIAPSEDTDVTSLHRSEGETTGIADRPTDEEADRRNLQ